MFRAEIISDISKGTKGAIKSEFPNLSPIKSTGGFIGYRYTFGDAVRNVYKESILNACKNRWVGAILPSESLGLSLLTTFILVYFLILTTDTC